MAEQEHKRERSSGDVGEAGSTRSASVCPSVSQHFVLEIKPHLEINRSFWFETVLELNLFRVAPKFFAALSAAKRKVVEANYKGKALEVDVYHPSFTIALKTAFNDLLCPAHAPRLAEEDKAVMETPVTGRAVAPSGAARQRMEGADAPQHRGGKAGLAPCPECIALRPSYTEPTSAKNIPFDGGIPDFLFRYRGNSQYTSLVEMKTQMGRRNGFLPADISQAVRYGKSILAAQPLRDNATVCLLTLEQVQFVRVFRSLRAIHTTTSESLFDEEGMPSSGLSQLHAYLTATPAQHGMRNIEIPGWGFLKESPQNCTLGSGSFSSVYEMAPIQPQPAAASHAALKLYQRVPNRTGYSTETFQREFDILQRLSTTDASVFVPQVLFHDTVQQWLLLTPVGDRLEMRHLTTRLVGQLVDALEALHQFYIHRDLRVANIIVVGGVKVKIIDWNLGLSIEEIQVLQPTAGALCVQGDAVLEAMSLGNNYSYSSCDDLRSLVRAIYLVFNPGVKPGKGSIEEWRYFWKERLTRCHTLPLLPETHAWHAWQAAEAAAQRGSYAGLKAALCRVVLK